MTETERGPTAARSARRGTRGRRFPIHGTRPAHAEHLADRLAVHADLSVHVLVNGERPRPTTAGKDKTAMDRLTEPPELLQARLSAQNEVANTRDALLRAVLTLPNNLQYLAEGGSFASTIIDLVRAIDAARLATHRAGCSYLHGSDEDRARWDAECAETTRREVAYTIERLQNLAAG